MSGTERFGSILDQLREGFQVIDPEWRYLYLNEEVCRQAHMTREELLGRSMVECFPGIQDTPLFALLRRCMDDRVAGEMDNEFTYPDGSKGYYELRVEPVPEGILVLSLDVGRRKALENELRQAQKLEALGRLTGGIAHDFNNIMAAVLGFGELARESLEPAHPAYRDVELVLSSAERAKVLVRQLLAFSRKQTIEPQVLRVNDLVREVEQLLRRLLGEDVDLVVRLGGDLGSVRLDPGAFEQVLVNLAINARDAMLGGGKLTVETFQTVLDRDCQVAKGRTVEPGEYVVLAVTDNGCGMDEATRARLFEPFFTTKPRDIGTGLGLSTCYGIVRQAGGYIWVYSEPGAGSTFKIYLPRVDARPEPIEVKPTGGEVGGGESILVVEDDPSVLALTVRLLRRLGYRVTEAPDPRQAILLCGDGHEPVDLLLTDVVLPQVSGHELARQLLPLVPNLKVLYMSGYSENAIVHHGVLDPGLHLVQKPFTSEILARKVRAALDG